MEEVCPRETDDSEKEKPHPHQFAVSAFCFSAEDMSSQLLLPAVKTAIHCCVPCHDELLAFRN